MRYDKFKSMTTKELENALCVAENDVKTIKAKLGKGIPMGKVGVIASAGTLAYDKLMAAHKSREPRPFKHSRDDYMQKRCTHREYYGQFVTPEMLDYLHQRKGDAIAQSEDPHFNDIPMSFWDSLPLPEFVVRAQSRASGQKGALVLSPSTKVCIWKAAAAEIHQEKQITAQLSQ